MKLPFLSLTLLVLQLAGQVTATRLSSASKALHASTTAGQECYGDEYTATPATSPDASHTLCKPLSALKEGGADEGHSDVMNAIEGTTKNQDGQGSTSHEAEQPTEKKKSTLMDSKARLVRRKLHLIRSIPAVRWMLSQRPKEKVKTFSVGWTDADVARLKSLESEGHPSVNDLKNLIELAKLALSDFEGKPNKLKRFRVKEKHRGHGVQKNDLTENSSAQQSHLEDVIGHGARGPSPRPGIEEERRELAEQIFKDRRTFAARIGQPNPFGLSLELMDRLGSSGQQYLAQLHLSMQQTTLHNTQAEKVAKYIQTRRGPPLATGGGTPQQQKVRKDDSTRATLKKKLQRLVDTPSTSTTQKGKDPLRHWKGKDTMRLGEAFADGSVALKKVADRARQRHPAFDQVLKDSALHFVPRKRRRVQVETSSSKNQSTTHSSTPAQAQTLAQTQAQTQTATDDLPYHPQPIYSSLQHHSLLHHPHSHPLSTNLPLAQSSLRPGLFNPFAPLVHDHEFVRELEGLQYLLNTPDPHDNSEQIPKPTSSESQPGDGTQTGNPEHLLG